MILRPYQTDLYQRVGRAFSEQHTKNKLSTAPDVRLNRVFMCLPTGGGKTAIFSQMARGAREKGSQVWICLPRIELIEQASETLSRLGVPHGRIAAGVEESTAFSLQLVSSSTLIRRWDKIKRPPEFIILDEAHLYYDRQLEICERFPNAKILGVSASPERLDGRGLADIYGSLVEGPSVKDLVEMGYLCQVRYLAPPTEGIKNVKRKGLDLDEGELATLFRERKIYGKAVEHYEQWTRGKTSLVFARSVEEAGKIAAEFRGHGWRFEVVSAKTPDGLRREILAAYKAGQIEGVVNCEIATYGLDVPRIESVILLRPTLSKALQTQMDGRGLRMSPETGKRHVTIQDHVGMIEEFGHPLDPYEWNFAGAEKRKRAKSDPSLRLKLCPSTFLYCEKPICAGCEYNTAKIKSRAEHVVDVQLREVEPAVKLNKRPIEERAVFQTRLDDAFARQKKANSEGRIDTAALEELLALARQIGNQPKWVYHRLSEGRLTVNVALLSEIARIEGYDHRWVGIVRRELEERLRGNLPLRFKPKKKGMEVKKSRKRLASVRELV